MTEIWNLSAICRCCHLDGSFKSLEVPYSYQNAMEIYSVIIQETFGIQIPKPPNRQSDSICDVCINKLRDAASFKLQIMTCEEKFREYLLNEEALNPRDIKVEVDYNDHSKKPLTSTSLIVEEMEVEVPGMDIKQEPKEDSDKEGNVDFDHDDAETKEIKQEDMKSSAYDNKSLIKKETNSKVEVKKSLKQKILKTKTKQQSSPMKKEQKPIEKTCKECNIEFNTRAELNRHNNAQHKNRGLYCCKDCPHKTEQFKEMSEHVKIHGKERVKCRFCDKDYQTKKSLTCHENLVHIKESVFICDLCNKIFKTRCSLIKHFNHNVCTSDNRSPAGVKKKFSCQICGHGTNYKSNLKIHINSVHSKLRIFKCTYCEQTCKTKRHLKLHLMVHDGDKFKQYTCKVCSATYRESRSFKKHTLIHGSEVTLENNTLYVCKGCPETFEDRGEYKSHVMKHSKEGTLPHLCDMCGLSFSYKYSLKKHVENHKNLKRYPCDICQKYFSQKTEVDRHKRNVHDPLKKEKTKCPICKNNVSDLEKHKEIHLVRPFLCGVCHRSYPSRTAMNRHMKQTHSGKNKRIGHS